VSAPNSAPNPSYRSIYRAGLLAGQVVIVTGGGTEEIMKDLAARQLGW
jgi:hypothetical protein